jgi:4-hydroxy-3-polyprenylbenzoate decarboxylase
MHDLVVAITGASGSIYAVRLLEILLTTGSNVHVIISPAAAQVCKHELGLTLDLENLDVPQLISAGSRWLQESKSASFSSGAAAGDSGRSESSHGDISASQLTYHHYQDYSAGIASGSFLTGGMVICPCSMGTLASLANGHSSNLIHRAADVHLKERRKLIVVPRETPLGSIQLENMKRLTDAGAVVLPAMPAFYHHPTTIHDLIDFVVGRICDQLGIAHNLFKRWGQESGVGD